ncbi:CWF19-like protein 2 [Argiope bruennichi]|uniref:CWF19-like protein 2 n=1 Tax=Argiope bruennichi TaxID=94029 RepID=UPI002494F413|nr:CWF19-like protein 2 [Argiope bruennichi]
MKEKKSHDSSSKHKHKKSKKHKKEKERKSSSHQSDSDEIEWVEAPPPPPPNVREPKEERQEWMNEELFVSTLSREEMKSGSSNRERKKLALEKQQEKEEAIKQARELNPHWKNNGSGLPDEEPDVKSLQLPSSSVGDGGYNYLKKAYIRIQEQAQREGRSMEEVAVERWGSLDKLVSMIDEAEARMETHSRDRYKSHHKRHKDYREREHSNHFQKPSDHHRSPSPEHSYRFQKPRDYDRNRKKNYLVSSSTDQKRKFYDDVSTFDEKDHSSQQEKTTKSGKEDCMVWERTSSPSSKPRVPAWKKVKAIEENPSKHEIEEQEQESVPEDRSSDSRKSTSHEPAVICSEDDLNRLAAKYFKANLSGDVAEASRLKEELDKARESFKSKGMKSDSEASTRQKEKVLLTKMNSSGYQQPISSSREEAGFDRNSGSKKRSEKFFDDTSRYSLKQMFEREKLTTTDDNIEMFLDVAAECNDKNARDEDDETSDISKKARQKMSHSVQEEKDIGRAIQQHQKLSFALKKCVYCMDNPDMKRHLIVSISEHAYLCLPSFQSLTEHHCLIVPKRHVSSFLQLDEDEWNDVEDMKNTLRRFFKKKDKTLLCLETSMYFRHYPHAFLECIPVPEEEGDMAPLYFKKALLESEEEWTHNIKLIDLTRKGLRRSVPKSLPYFCISFDPSVHAGFAHVIEDEKQFPKHFGKEVVGGMLDIDYHHLYKNKKDDPVKKSAEALHLTRMLEKFTEGKE